MIAGLAGGPARAEWTYFDNNADIRALYADGDTLWIGTNGGVVLYDLLQNQVVGKIVAGPGLPGNSVRAIRAHAGDIVVATDVGLAINPLGEAVVLTKTDDRVYSDIRNISWGIDSTLFVSTLGHGVGAVKGEEIRHITREDSLLGNSVFDVAEVDTARVYYATSLGLCAYRDSAWVGFQAGAGLPRGAIRQLIPVGDDRFYVRIEGRGIYRFNHSRSVRIGTRDAFGEDEVAAIALDADGALWAAGRFGGLAKYRGGTWTAIGQGDEQVSRAKWRCAYAGPDGRMFFGSADGLVAIVEAGALRTARIESLLPSGYIGPMAAGPDGETFVVNGPYLLSGEGGSDRFELETTTGSVFAVATSTDGTVWASTPWGLLQREKGRWIEVRPDIEPRVPRFVSLAIDPATGDLWLGAHTGEVFRYDGRFWVEFAGPHEFAGGAIFRLLVDPYRTVWAFSPSSGAHRYDGAQWTTYGLETFDSLRLNDAALDASGAPVVVTDRGLWRFSSDYGWQRLLTSAPTDIGQFRSIYFDGLGRMYLGTTDGLALVEPGREGFIGARDGLRGRNVTALLVDSNDYLWVGFRDDGISRISLEKLW